MIQARNLGARHRRPRFGGRVPHLGGEYRRPEIAETRPAGSAGDQDLAVWKDRRIELPARELHRRDLAPDGVRLGEIDDFGRLGRRIAAARHEDPAGAVHHGGSVVAIHIEGMSRDHAPRAGAGGVQGARHRARCRVEHPAVRHQMHARIEVEKQLRAGQMTPCTALNLEDRGKRVLSHRALMLPEATSTSPLLRSRSRGVPAPGMHIGHAGPEVVDRVVRGRVRQADTILDVTARHEQSAAPQEDMTGTEEVVARRGRGGRRPGGRIPQAYFVGRVRVAMSLDHSRTLPVGST